MICWVRRAMVTARSEGSASTSVMLVVCRDCVPPITAARAWKATRTILFSGCWAVRLTPAFFNDTATTEIYALSLHDPDQLQGHAASFQQLGIRRRYRV